MQGSLIKISDTVVSSDTASVTITGIDSTYEIYKLILNNIVPATNGQSLRMRITKGGTVQTDANYDEANHGIRSDQYSWNDQYGTNATYWNKIGPWSTSNTSTENGASGSAILYLFNFDKTGENTFITVEGVGKWAQGLLGIQGCAVHTVDSASDGVNFFFSSGDIASGTFSLYGLKK